MDEFKKLTKAYKKYATLRCQCVSLRDKYKTLEKSVEDNYPLLVEIVDELQSAHNSYRGCLEKLQQAKTELDGVADLIYT